MTLRERIAAAKGASPEPPTDPRPVWVRRAADHKLSPKELTR